MSDLQIERMRLIAQMLMVSEQARHDTVRFGEWQADYAGWHGLINEQYDKIGAADNSSSAARCSNCGGSGIIRWQAYDGTEEGHEEQDPCPVCTADKSSAAEGSK